MRIARFTTGDDPRFGFLQRDNDRDYIAVLSGDPLYTPIAPTGERIELGDGVRLLAPVIPRSKVIGVGRNYADHVKEMGNEMPTQPLLFLKPNTSVVGPDDPIVLPPFSQEVSYEAELAVVIGRMTKDVTPENAHRHILGYTIANDVTARDAQRTDGQWARAKGFDSSCPLGPWIDTDLNTEALTITTTVNGEQRQHGSTADMIFDVAYLVSYISEAFTLLPGDVILTGTPAGVGTLTHGDRVECSIDGLGTLSNIAIQRHA
ncbi:fumarylacetoacetate hydrolase family protein [Jonesia denitrificans]|uniref:5-carboxymethyl-2-hydroxymuconate Delta-isomerase n=1 Tax=Jonesia denitrificans (strain ATCC 14870 / DSM 20603 / BCRC 15368 / CIP 55.134 / JCM 11481 / NBRC 15587 / NCTC 10816 / Prevot 55134) TaxID=471856 RepID=C7QYU6_JONDD|nr:fumarylacetoacetate hydrolase family protein [Jonesia denitrificans]ACV09335.1 5-carboxymethyl-2-hydroxymuconate Delta- isomerase [Jonesia denitrificans DSM 20603]ASE09412.1 FAA hydrolase family protein [Jonesia denitrificans]QXB43959.1 fumarylacetoacetate hydrolase family protein [Jonesia denitrificans]SQH21612.1 2-keto-4-pentenoate hydratase/2-oxohepta-3-ene-1,7-dioic acid hydratase (catechol pathway) [Jonesia denitrificans]